MRTEIFGKILEGRTMRDNDDLILGTIGQPVPSPGGSTSQGFWIGGPKPGLGVPKIVQPTKIDPIELFDLTQLIPRATGIGG